MRILPLLLFCSVALAEPVQPVAKLPHHVVAAKGQVTLFADYGSAKDGHVKLYLVNRTDRPLALDTQDGTPYFKLEAKGTNGRWERAEGHLHSSCGNSYYPVQVAAGTFRVFRGLFPEKGERRAVRFREYSLAGQHPVGSFRSFRSFRSNVGEGRVSLAEIARVKGDRMTVVFGTEEEILALALGKLRGR